jgi:hypothetical protein
MTVGERTQSVGDVEAVLTCLSVPRARIQIQTHRESSIARIAAASGAARSRIFPPKQAKKREQPRNSARCSLVRIGSKQAIEMRSI